MGCPACHMPCPPLFLLLAAVLPPCSPCAFVRAPCHALYASVCPPACRDNEPEVRTAATSKLSAFARLIPVADVTAQVRAGTCLCAPPPPPPACQCVLLCACMPFQEGLSCSSDPHQPQPPTRPQLGCHSAGTQPPACLLNRPPLPACSCCPASRRLGGTPTSWCVPRWPLW